MQEPKIIEKDILQGRFEQLNLHHQELLKFEKNFVSLELKDTELKKYQQNMRDNYKRWNELVSFFEENREKSKNKQTNFLIQANLKSLESLKKARYTLQCDILQRKEDIDPKNHQNIEKSWNEAREILKNEIRIFLTDLMKLENLKENKQEVLEKFILNLLRRLQELKIAVNQQAINYLKYIAAEHINGGQSVQFMERQLNKIQKLHFVKIFSLSTHIAIEAALFVSDYRKKYKCSKTEAFLQYLKINVLQQGSQLGEVLSTNTCTNPIDHCLQTLFPDETDCQKEVKKLPNEFKMMQNLIVAIQDFPIKEVRELNTQDNKTKKRHEVLMQKFKDAGEQELALKELQKAITLHKSENLENENTINELSKILISILTCKDEYELIYQNFLKYIPTKHSLVAMLETQNLAEINLESLLETATPHLQKIKEFNEMLQNSYTQKKQKLLDILSIEIENAKKFVEFVEFKNKFLIEKLPAESIDKAEQLKKQILETTDTLQKIEDTIKPAILDLQQLIVNAKETITNKLSIQIEISISEANQICSEVRLNQLSEHNPSKSLLKLAHEAYTENYKILGEHLNKVKTLSAQDIEEWNLTFIELKQKMDEKLQKIKDINQHTLEIERRINSPLYKIYTEISLSLRSEHKNIKSDLCKKLFNKIEMEFREFKNNYISKNGILDENNIKKTDLEYCQDLKKLVKSYLQSDYMIKWSDGERSTFIQFIRKHILKPLKEFINRVFEKYSRPKDFYLIKTDKKPTMDYVKQITKSNNDNVDKNFGAFLLFESELYYFNKKADIFSFIKIEVNPKIQEESQIIKKKNGTQDPKWKKITEKIDNISTLKLLCKEIIEDNNTLYEANEVFSKYLELNGVKSQDVIHAVLNIKKPAFFATDGGAPIENSMVSLGRNQLPALENEEARLVNGM